MTRTAPERSTRDVDLAEFQKLRDEIMARTQLVNTLVGVELAALGAGISSFTAVPDVLIGLAAVSSFLWLLWLDHAEQVQKIAAYIALRLRPRLAVGTDQVLRWETYMRQLDREPRMPHTQAVSNYIAGLFAGGPVVLLTIYGLVVNDRFEDGSFPQVARFVGLGIAVLLWLVTLRQYRVFRGVVATIERAIGEARKDVAGPLVEEAAQP
ncbi:MAG TPA: hypothetical protein VE644_02130 [Gaiellaceae bacterium]|nr:hypothetical protein [Gaiellaceae bacterium]